MPEKIIFILSLLVPYFVFAGEKTLYGQYERELLEYQFTEEEILIPDLYTLWKRGLELELLFDQRNEVDFDMDRFEDVALKFVILEEYLKNLGHEYTVLRMNVLRSAKLGDELFVQRRMRRGKTREEAVTESRFLMHNVAGALRGGLNPILVVDNSCAQIFR